MSDDPKDARNPLIIPTRKEPVQLTGCPKCGARKFSGRNIQNVITWTCFACGNQWHGGLPQEPQDPRIPVAPINPADRPSVDFLKTRTGEMVEQRRRVDLTQSFRRGIPLPEEDE